MEELHLWHTSRVQPDLFEFIYASRFHVHISCVGFKPLKSQIRITKTKDMPLKLKDQFPRFTDLMIQVGQQRVVSSPDVLGIRQVRFMTSCVSVVLHMLIDVMLALDCSGSRRLLVGMRPTTYTLYIPLYQISCLCRTPTPTR